MASLLRCPCSTEALEARRLMDVPEAHARPRRHNHLLAQRTHFSSWPVSLRFLSPYVSYSLAHICFSSFLIASASEFVWVLLVSNELQYKRIEFNVFVVYGGAKACVLYVTMF